MTNARGQQLSIPGAIYNDLPAEVKSELASQSMEVRQKFAVSYLREYKKTSTAYWLLLCYGLHLNYLNLYSQGIWFWFTVGGGGVWWFLIEPFRLPSLIRQYNNKLARKILPEIIPHPAPGIIVEKN
ncbi:MAG TPA: hypothetical protein VEH58_06975 [Dehalococcoidales bacterium]|nr:hypothetical protein [Dehalococcoidales bacterium]